MTIQNKQKLISRLKDEIVVLNQDVLLAKEDLKQHEDQAYYLSEDVRTFCDDLKEMAYSDKHGDVKDLQNQFDMIYDAREEYENELDEVMESEERIESLLGDIETRKKKLKELKVKKA